MVYSDAYERRLTWHLRISWAMLPLFAASYYSGDQIIENGSDAPGWARSLHGPAAAGRAAAGRAVLFGVNGVTGVWNLFEGRYDPNGCTRRFLHGALFLAASGGFMYAATLAGDLDEGGRGYTRSANAEDDRLRHRNVARSSVPPHCR